MNPIIKVSNISKRYKLGQIQGYKTLRDSLSNLLSLRARSVGQASRLSHNQGRGNPNSSVIPADSKRESNLKL